MIDKGTAYYCTCTKERLDDLRTLQQKQKQIPKYDKYCLARQKEVKDEIKRSKPYVIRLNVPSGREIVFHDIIRGDVKVVSDNLDDQVLIKSDGFPTYHLGVVVDDYLMKISHVIRAEEWLSSTPKHISKRKNPVWASWYLRQGFLPEAVLNYLALMGWSHPEQKEIFSLDEFVKVFDLKDVKSVGPAFDPVKLEWMNGEYLRKTQNSKLKTQIHKFLEKKYPEEIIEKTIPLIRERIKKLSDYLALCEFFFKKPERLEIDLSSKKAILSKMSDSLSTISDWKAEGIGRTMQDLARKEGVKTGEFFMTLRVVITGKKISPPLNESMEILEKKECLERLKKLI